MIPKEIIEIALDEIVHTPEKEDPQKRVDYLCKSISTSAYNIMLQLISAGYGGKDIIEKSWKLAEKMIIKSDKYHLDLLQALDEKILEEAEAEEADNKDVN